MPSHFEGMTHADANRSAAGHARRARPQGAVVGTTARTRRRAAHSAHDRRRVRGARRIALRRPAPPRGTAMDRRRLGPLGPRKACEVLSADGGGPEPSPRRGGHVAPVRGGRAQAARRDRPTSDGGRAPKTNTPKGRRYLRFWGSDPQADVDDEFRFHLETEIEELVAKGMTPEAARDDAMRRFGDVAYYRRYCEQADARRGARERRANLLDALRQDVRFTIRSLIAQPVFTIVAVITLGLGIGANTAIFSVVNGVLLAPLPYREPDRLVRLWESMQEAPKIMVSYPDYLDWRARTHSFEHLSIYNPFDSFNY